MLTSSPRRVMLAGMTKQDARWFERPFPQRWEKLLWFTLAAVAVVGLVISVCGYKRRPDPSARWFGMDRARVACTPADNLYPGRRLRCAGEGRMYECVSDDGEAWQCATVGTTAAPAERAP